MKPQRLPQRTLRWPGLLVLLADLLPWPALAQTPPQPSIALDTYTVAPGQPLTISG
ncbi:MAG: hypothetical protein KatS3mg051_1782 [Anaerolineae bacterium]|nr:MAG: hypothetical protein KatS3mg051_1782 [Anaerolineae bacterium]